MNIFMIILQIVIVVATPALIVFFRNTKLIKAVGTISIAYIVGILVSVILFLIRLSGFNVSFDAETGQIIGFVSIGIAIPLLLFSTELGKIKNISKKALISFGLLIFSVVIVSVSTFFIFRNNIEQNGALVGMAIGLYTGGTPNLNAIGSILGVKSQIIAIANLSDMLIGGVFYLFLLTICKPILKKFLTASTLTNYYNNADKVKNVDELDTSVQKKPLIRNLIIAFAITLIGALLGFVVWLIIGKKGAMTDYIVPIMMIVVTIGGIIGSFNKKIRNVKGNNSCGLYLILVFSIAISMSIVWEDISINSLYILGEFSFITLVTFMVHVILNKIFKIDVDCAMVTATAGIYGPAFVPAITASLKNDNLTAVGLILGSIGYAIGTFLGAGLGFLLLLI